MAQLKKIVRGNPISNFRQAVPSGGTVFSVLAEGLNQLYETTAPEAARIMQERGVEGGSEWASGLQTGGGRDAFKRSLSRTESGGDYTVVNSEGFGGKYQFGEPRLQDFNRATGANVTFEEFMADPDLQERVMDWQIDDIDAQLGQYAGTKIGNTVLTKNAIRAMAHLGGVGGARRYITSGGLYDPADSNGTSLSDYARIHGSVPDEPTVTRNSAGQLESRLYSPYSGPILQAHNAAAEVAYNAQVLNQGAADLLDMSNDFRLNPDGFQEAAQGYVNQLIENSPSPFRAELRQSLEQEVQRRFLGMVAEKQADTRARANNESSALMSRYSDEYAQAIASGNEEEAAAALGNLTGILEAREVLPGAAWTRAQSENVVLKAEETGQKIIDSRWKEVSKEYSTQLDLITGSRKNGRVAGDESAAYNPEVVAMHPEKAAEAQAYIAIGEALPSFKKSPKAERDAAVAGFLDDPVMRGFELDVGKHLQTLNKNINAAWERDPIEAATEYLGDVPTLTLDNPQTMVESMQARRVYGNNLKDQGFVDYAAFLSQAESEQLAALMGVDQPPETRALMASAIVSGFGRDATRVFDQIEAEPVIRYGGKLMAVGGSPNIVMQAITGQQLLDANQVQLPPKSDRLSAFDPTIEQALAGVPNPAKAQKEIMDFAQAIYAARSQGLSDPDSAAATTRMQDSINTALGQSTNARGEKTGGVQEIGGHSVLMPLNVSGEAVQRAINSTLSAEGATFADLVVSGLVGGIPGMDGSLPQTLDTTAWKEASPRGLEPMWGSKPITADLFQNGNVRFVAAGSNLYRMEVVSGATVTDVTTPGGGVFFFDMQKFIEATQ